MATGNFMIPGRVSPAQQQAGDAAAAAKNTRGTTQVHTKSDNNERKTDVKNGNLTPEKQFEAESKQQVVQSGESNVLNGYRSVTYNISLSALDGNDLANPERYRNSDLKYLILKSGGKGSHLMTGGSNVYSAGISDPNAPEKKENKTAADKAAARTRRNSGTLGQEASDFFDGFNSESPGRFDMFIENIDIETLMSPGAETNVTLATKIKFDVIEPYSVNGFIEALHVSALAAGYPNYLLASFLLKMEFWGYPDNVDLPEPEKIKNAERYFPIGIVEMEVDITDKGTRYRCNAVPYNERSFGQPNVIKKPIKMTGKTVKEIIKNLFKSINQQGEEDAVKSGRTGNQRDIYQYKFEKWDPSQGFVNADFSTEIGNSKFTEILKDNALYNMNDPAGPNVKPNAYKRDGAAQPSPGQQSNSPEAIKYNPDASTIHFPEGLSVSDCIISVVKDSDYTKNLLKNIGKPGVPDEFGMIDYFLIRLEVTNQTNLDSNGQKPYQIYTYIIAPYKIHISRVPNYGHNRYPEENLKKLSLREYNYIYTGKNIDVLNFKLHFNTLYFEGVPAEMANKDTPGPKNSAVPANTPKVKRTPKSGNSVMEQSAADQIPLAPLRVITTPVQAPTGGNAGQPRDNPYNLLAKHLHEAVVNSKSGMLTGEIEILGDPFFLVTSGAGNYRPPPGGKGKTATGEAEHNYSEVIITINFRNPIDYGGPEQGGMMQFNKNRTPFSGAYRVLKQVSSFRDGIFKQKLDILRVPGQVLDNSIQSENASDVIAESPKSGSQVVPSESRAPEARAPASSTEALNRLTKKSQNENSGGGNIANLGVDQVDALGGLGGDNLISPFLDPMQMAQNSLNLGTNSGQLQDAAELTSAVKVLNGGDLSYPISTAVATDIVNMEGIDSANVANMGSGIGKDATLLVTPASSIPSSFTANEIKQGLNIDDIKAPGRIISSNNVLSTNALSSIRNNTNADSLVGGLGNKLAKLNAPAADPSGIASGLGLDPRKTSGLFGGNLVGNLSNKISDIFKNVPSNVNLERATAAGLAVDLLPASKLANIPATPPYSTAPVAQSDVAYANTVLSRGGPNALADLYGVNSISKLSSSIVPQELISGADQYSSPVPNPFANQSTIFNKTDASVITDKLATANSQLSKYTNVPSIPDMGSLSSVSSKYGSSSMGQSPLDKLVGKIPKSDINDFYG